MDNGTDGHLSRKAPLTEGEKTLEDVKQAEAEASRGTSARSSHVGRGLKFPMSDEATTALQNLMESNENLVQLVLMTPSHTIFSCNNLHQRIDLPTEKIELAEISISDADDLSQAITEDEPRFSLYRYGHEFEGQHLSPIVFVYTCPNGAKVRERMVYAAARASVIAYANYEAGLRVEKKVRQAGFLN